jgi:plasmid stabilization system protein ParE
MRVVFSELARLEMDDATAYYETAFEGLGSAFKSEVRKAALRIAKYPHAWAVVSGDVRKCLLHKFPYSLLYAIEADHIFIIAIAHHHRRPTYWVGRSQQTS